MKHTGLVLSIIVLLILFKVYAYSNDYSRYRGLTYLFSGGISYPTGYYNDYLKSGKNISLELERNPDIIAEIGKNKGNRILVGFAMETQNLFINAREKLINKNMDLIVANNLRQEGAGFRTETNIITIIDRSGKSESLGKMTKIDAAGAILDNVKKIMSGKGRVKK